MLLAVPALAFLVYVFSQARSAPVGGEARAVCGLVVDRSPSTAQPLIREQFEEGITKTLDRCADLQAQLVLYSVDSTGDEVRRAGDFPLYPEKARRAKLRDKSSEERIEAASTAAFGLLDDMPEGSGGSNILRAMDLAASRLRSFAGSEGVEVARLVVLSDGLQASSGVSVAMLNERATPIAPLLDAARSSGTFPEMAGVTVDMVGVGAGTDAEGAPLPGWFRAKVAEFWTAVVSEAGGTVCHIGIDTPPELPAEVCS